MQATGTAQANTSSTGGLQPRLQPIACDLPVEEVWVVHLIKTSQ
jgi:hypothetical protein